MGDRANAIIKDVDGEVFLYTHWNGSELPYLVQTALQRKQRWDDPAYLARIVFCTMVKGSEADETGYGISTVICDNEHPLTVIDTAQQEVRIESEDRQTVYTRCSFAHYCELTREQIETLHENARAR